MSVLAFIARRYIAGVDMTAAIDAARRLNTSGLLASLDNLGENAVDEGSASAPVREYLALLDLIAESGVEASVSIKLTQLGLDLSDDVAYRNADAIVGRAASLGNFARIDMEGSKYTERTLRIFRRLHDRHGAAVGVAVQAMLKRSAADVAMLIERGASVRLVKGAYKEPPEIAYQKRADVIENFRRLMKELLVKGTNPAMATHDEGLIREAKEFAAASRIPDTSFDFEMLLGIKRSLQASLAAEGKRVRIYVPYGTNWLPYTMRRLRERKENVFFVLKSIFD